jgi:ribonuclease D
MNEAEITRIALKAADSAILLERPVDVQRASKAWQRSGVLGLDTEFVRERTYFANLGLVQISDGQTVWLVDPMDPDTLEPIGALFRSRSITKLFHSPSEDLEVLLHTTGTLPDPMIDTQAACALLGKPLQMGYHTAVQWLFGVELDKEQTRSNWCARPLKRAQLHYAALDVCLLPEMWSRLQHRLEQKGRLDWLVEDCQRQLDRAKAPVNPTDVWQRIRGVGRLDGQSLALLQTLVQWREEEARRKNRPRGFIVKDDVLREIAERRPRHAGELSEVEDLHPNAARRYGDVICEIVERVLADGTELEPMERLSSRQNALLNRLRGTTAATADALGLEPTVLATKRELEQLVRTHPDCDIPERLRGWRKKVVTDNLIEILKEDGA